jgi:hypothetical protein
MYFYFSLDKIPYIYMQFTLIVEVFYVLALILLLNPWLKNIISHVKFVIILFINSIYKIKNIYLK